MKAILNTRDGCVRPIEVISPPPSSIHTLLDYSRPFFPDHDSLDEPIKKRVYELVREIDGVAIYLEACR